MVKARGQPGAPATARETSHPAAGTRSGFTLIELLVVLAIIATLLLLVAPRYWGHLETAKEAVLRDNLRGVRSVIDSFHSDHGRYPENLEELVEKAYLRSPPIDPLTGLADSWTLVQPPEGLEGGLYDIHSGAPGTARDGSPYAQW